MANKVKSFKPASATEVPCFLRQSRISKRWYFSATKSKPSIIYDANGKVIEQEGNAIVEGSGRLEPDAFTTRMLPETYKGAPKTTVLKTYFEKGYIDTLNGNIRPR